MRRETAAISPVADVVAAIRAGEIVILVDDEDRENEGDLIFAAEFVTPEKINFLAKHGRGLICMAVTEEHAARLGLKPMVEQNRSRHGTNFTVSIEAAEGIASGISAPRPRAHRCGSLQLPTRERKTSCSRDTCSR
jgi:3,4-dihydroxy 2-butanone 4-phosphate synthase/GTP cyclohydrolase II